VRTRPRRGTSGLVYLARWPSRKAAQHARDRIRLLTMRARLAAPVEQIVQEVNAFLRGWVGFFRYGNSAREFDKIRTYAVLRARCLSPSATSGAGHGGIAQVYRSPDSLGLIFLNGTSSPPGRSGPGGLRSNTAGEGRRWACAGEPHARFDGEGLQTEQPPPRPPLTQPISRLRDVLKHLGPRHLNLPATHT
jgi:RNA-directed DNA polymerase